MQTKLYHVQKAVYDLLSASTSLPGIYDETPDDSTFPYITLGDFTEERFDTMGNYGSEITFNVHIWSQYRGYKEAYEYLAIVDSILDYAELSSSGFSCVYCRNEFVNTLMDPDGITRHVVSRYRVIVQGV